MSRQADEQKQRKVQNSPKKAAKPATGLRTWKPSIEERQQIKSIDLPFEDIWATVASYAEDGIGLSLGYDQTSKAYFLIARKKTGQWDTDPAVSVWHEDPAICVAQIWYYLGVKFPRWPESLLEATEEDFGW